MQAKKPKKTHLKSPPNLQMFERTIHYMALLLIIDGLSNEAISRSATKALRAAARTKFNSAAVKFSAVALSEVLHAWHQDVEYLDSKASPIPLPLKGKGKSIQRLAARAGAHLPLGQIISSLKSQGLIRRLQGGRYLPTMPVARIETDGAELAGYVGQAVFNLVKTCEANRQARDPRKPLLERAALVRDLSRNDLAAFKAFAAEQGGNMISSANIWLEARRKRSRRKPNPKNALAAGLHVFAFTSTAE